MPDDARLVLDIEDLEYQRPERLGGFEVSLPRLSLRAGDRITLTGASGSGKSTLLDLIGFILKPKKVGRYLFTQRDGTRVDVSRHAGPASINQLAPLRRKSVGYILQHGGLMPFLTVRENVLLCAPLSRPCDNDVSALAKRLGIERLLDRTPNTLSLGERQRVAIARALISAPDLIIADEPTASLDPPTAMATLELLTEIVDGGEQVLILASHDWRLVEKAGFSTLEASFRTSDKDGHVTASFS